MRLLPPLIVLICVAGCASMGYSKIPEPTGAWVPANPPRVVGESPPSAHPARLPVTAQGGWR